MLRRFDSAKSKFLSLFQRRRTWHRKQRQSAVLTPRNQVRQLGKEITYAGHGDFDGFEEQLRKTGSPSWLTYDLRVMFQGYVERGFSNTEDQTARFAALLGHQPRTYSSFAEEEAKEWAAA